MEIKEYKMRQIEESDLAMILAWRNSDEIHSMMLTEHKISREEHWAWFHKMKKHAIATNFIFEYKNKPIGYIGYTSYDITRRKCSPGAYIGERRVASIDCGFYLMYLAADYAFNALGMECLETMVFSKNVKALHIDQFIGYKIVAEISKQYKKNGQLENAVLLNLTKATWLKNHSNLLKLID